MDCHETQIRTVAAVSLLRRSTVPSVQPGFRSSIRTQPSPEIDIREHRQPGNQPVRAEDRDGCATEHGKSVNSGKSSAIRPMKLTHTGESLRDWSERSPNPRQFSLTRCDPCIARVSRNQFDTTCRQIGDNLFVASTRIRQRNAEFAAKSRHDENTQAVARHPHYVNALRNHSASQSCSEQSSRRRKPCPISRYLCVHYW